MKRRALALLLAVVLVAALAPVAALADEPHVHDVSVDCGHDAEVTFTPWTSATSLPTTAAGNYYLTQDVSLTSWWDITISGEISLCLNGHKIMADMADDIIELDSSKGPTLSICDCQEEQGAIIANENNKLGLVMIYGSSTLNLYGGKLTGGHATDPVAAASYGVASGGVSLLDSRSTFNMYGGEISGCTGCYAGGVSVQSGTFNMSGGTITNNTVTGDNDNGGGVCMAGGAMNVSGAAKITGNKKAAAANNVYLAGGARVNVVGANGLTAGAGIGVSIPTWPETGSTAVGNNNADSAVSGYKAAPFFTPDNSDYEAVEDAEGVIKVQKKAVVDETAPELVSAVADGDTGKVTFTFSEAVQTTGSHKLTITKDGAPLEWTQVDSDGKVFTVNGGGGTYSLTFRDLADNASSATPEVAEPEGPEEPPVEPPEEPEVIKITGINITYAQPVIGGDMGKAKVTVTTVPSVKVKDMTAIYRALEADMEALEDEDLDDEAYDAASEALMQEAIYKVGADTIGYAAFWDYAVALDAFEKGEYLLQCAIGNLRGDAGVVIDVDNLVVKVNGKAVTEDSETEEFFPAEDMNLIFVGACADAKEPSKGGSSRGGDRTGSFAATVAEQPKHGKVELSTANAGKDALVTVAVTAQEKYKVAKVTVTDAAGNDVAVTAADAGGKYTFLMPASAVSVKADVVWDNPFTDVTDAAWFRDVVEACHVDGLMDGVGGGLFAPGRQLSRAQLAQILYNQAGKPAVEGGSELADVAADAWYADAVAFTVGKGVFDAGGSFGPEELITREEMAVALYRYAGQPAIDRMDSLAEFIDREQVSPDAETAMQWAVKTGIILGRGDGTVDPKATASRAEVAAMLARYFVGK